jgi:hypothetical protein
MGIMPSPTKMAGAAGFYELVVIGGGIDGTAR